MKRVISSFVAAVTMGALITGCGSSNVPTAVSSGIQYERGLYKGVDEFYAQCQNPVDSYESKGSVLAEKHFVRELLNDIYLWYKHVPDINPAQFASPNLAFDTLIAEANLAQSVEVQTDRFSFAIPQEVYEAYFVDGEVAEFGATWVFANETAADNGKPISVRVAYVVEGSPAANAGLRRGDTLTVVGNRTLASTTQANDKSVVWNALHPSRADQSLNLTYKRAGESTLRTTTVTSQVVTSVPVHHTSYFGTDNGKVGYLVYNSFLTERASTDLIAAITDFRNQGIDELVLDLRYNSGGRVTYANQLASMIAGTANTQGKLFVRTQFNDRYQNESPYGPSYPLEELYVQEDESGADLPSLNLSRVFVLTTGDTCSASELVMNSLRGIDIEVIQIGGTTCGKPYAFAGIENCEWVYFPVQSLEVNAKGFGNYTNGFTATGTPTALDQIKGCPLADDLDSPLGSQNEDLLATALHYIDNNNCNAALATGNAFKPQATPVEYTSGKPAWQKAMFREVH